MNKKYLKNIFVAIVVNLLIINILTLVVFAVIYGGLGSAKTVKNIDIKYQTLIANAFGLDLDLDEKIIKFNRAQYNNDYYYSIYIDNINNIEDFKNRNNQIRFFVEKKYFVKKQSLYSQCILYGMLL